MHRLGWPFTLALSLLAVALFSLPPQKPPRGDHHAPLLARKELLYVLGAGYRQLLADYYWLQTIQATGLAHDQYEYRDIYFYADMATDLDPALEYAYIFAGTAVTYNLGREQWVNTEESTRILEKGFQHFPGNVYLRILLAYNYSYYHGRYKQAADLLTETSRMPGAPRYLTALATRLYAQAGEFDAGLALASSLAESAGDEETKEAFQRRVQEIQLERELQQVDKASEAYKARTGEWPPDVEALVRAHDLPRMPVDPLGGSILIGPEGRSHSTSEGHRLEIYGKENRP